MFGERDQVTDMLEVLETVAVNWPDWPGLRVVDVGLTEIDTDGGEARRVREAEADLEESAWLVAVTVTFCWEETVEGAV